MPWYDRDIAFKLGSRCVDYIAASEGLTPHLEVYEVIHWDEKLAPITEGMLQT